MQLPQTAGAGAGFARLATCGLPPWRAADRGLLTDWR